ncbi:hypothetical protein AYI68_g735 [Smittium mucronatum]|uniref:SET domain-containing protein n=1 Tax=Smittium mucronatum TaxID=133383 RepID=A0A1R0H7D3_9FUNG|nr:hypothetical protein AYI68_g735 [Smittium mucronatum]
MPLVYVDVVKNEIDAIEPQPKIESPHQLRTSKRSRTRYDDGKFTGDYAIEYLDQFLRQKKLTRNYKQISTFESDLQKALEASAREFKTFVNKKVKQNRKLKVFVPKKSQKCRNEYENHIVSNKGDFSVERKKFNSSEKVSDPKNGILIKTVEAENFSVTNLSFDAISYIPNNESKLKKDTLGIQAPEENIPSKSSDIDSHSCIDFKNVLKYPADTKEVSVSGKKKYPIIPIGRNNKNKPFCLVPKRNSKNSIAFKTSSTEKILHNSLPSLKDRPRWYNQVYVLFLALRQCKNYISPKSELLRKAIDLDYRLSMDLGVRKAFSGPSPISVADSVLTRNDEKMFLKVHIKGDRKIFYTLTYKPGDFNSAAKNYNEWMITLINHDWPKCFNGKAINLKTKVLNDDHDFFFDASFGFYSREENAFINSENFYGAKFSNLPFSENTRICQSKNVIKRISLIFQPISKKNNHFNRQKFFPQVQNELYSSDSINPIDNHFEPGETLLFSGKGLFLDKSFDSSLSTLSKKINRQMFTSLADKNVELELKPSNHKRTNHPTEFINNSVVSSNETSSQIIKSKQIDPKGLDPEPKSFNPDAHDTSALFIRKTPYIQSPKSDVKVEKNIKSNSNESHNWIGTHIPKKLSDIVEVRRSGVPSSGDGLFATRFLPKGIPLGFYFGVPMTEDEFDSLKDRVGNASQYSIMYLKTILDATDENGNPYRDPNGPIFCPFHFMNEDRNNYNMIFEEGSIVNQVICITVKDILPGEELFVNYGLEIDRENWE